MATTDSFLDLMARLRGGDDAAAAQVFQRFAGQILELARQQLHDRIRRKLDPEDILQSVFRSFFLRQRDGRLDLENWDNLWGVLMVMTLRKCGRQVQHFQAARRDLRHEVGLDTLPKADGLRGLVSLESSPSQAAMLIELLTQLVEVLAPADREILTLRLQGYTVAEIADQLGRSTRTVCRALRRIRQRLSRLTNDEEHTRPRAPASLL
jgi:RNA polymerase sigma-70 factor (ECF subfamily)